MVEFYAWVDDHLRTICGLTQGTTCWQVVEALCEATGKKGQHLLWEVWRDFGRPISPRESVVSLMRQWGQELPTVRFVLRSKEEGSLVKRRALSRKHKLFYYTEEQKVREVYSQCRVIYFGDKTQLLFVCLCVCPELISKATSPRKPKFVTRDNFTLNTTIYCF